MVETPKRTLTAPFWPITPRNPEGMPRWANDITFALSAAFGQLITRIEDVTDAGSTERLGLLTPIGSRKFYYDQGSTDLYFDTPDAEWARVGSADMTSGYFATKEPTGFLDKSETTLSWDDGTRTLTLTLVGSDATVYHNGRLITLTTNLSKQITDVDGQHYIFIDSDGELQSSTALYSQEFIRDEIAVAEVYWNSTDSEATIVADERHGLMPWQVHLWLHLFQGAQRRSGLGLGSILADDTGASNTHAEMSVSSGVILDEDNEITIGSSVAPAKIPVLAKRGVSAEWYIAGYSNAPLVLNGSSIPYYNSVGGGGWSLTAVTNTKFTLVHIFATNDIRYGYIAVMGEAEYNNIIDARDGANNEISQITTAGLPMDEFVAVGTVIYQINTAYTNSYNARIVSTTTGDDYVSWLSGAPYNAATGPSSHASLVDRDLPDQHPADAIDVDITGFSGILSGTDTDVQTALDTIDAHTHSYLPLTGGELSGDLTLANGVALRGKDTGGTAYDMIELRSDNILQIGKAKDVRIGDYDGGSYVWVHYSDGDIYMAGGNLTLSTGNIDASAGYIDADQGAG